MKRLLFALFTVLILAGHSVQAQTADDQYVAVYSLMQQANALEETGQTSTALAKFLEAQAALQRLQKMYPVWNTKVVNFRLEYFENKIAGLTAKGSSTNAATASPAATSAASDQRIAALENEIRRLQNEKTVLEAKLKEAFATQPAAIDPRELASAGEKIQALMRENELLKVSAAQGEGVGMDQKAIEQIRKALDDTSRKLAEQTERADNLALEKETLQKRLNVLSAQSSDQNAQPARDAVAAANKKIEEQAALAKRLTIEKEALETRLKDLKEAADSAQALRDENAALKSQLAQAATKTSAAGSNAQAGPQLAALQSEANRLRLENETLQNRLKLATTSRADDAARIQQLERERSELQKDKPSERRGILFWRKPSDASDNPDREKELSQQIAALRARIETFEAQAVPYSAEELALIKTQTAPAVSSRASKTQSAKTPPPGTESLAAEAQRSFASRRFEEAERKYLEILRHDINSVYTLANLAAIQLELGRLAEAEKHVKQALAQSPNDSYSLSILGYLKFRQESYDDAVDALSRAAELDPQNPEIQNYLGVALSHKGMRKPAETALRKAVVIEPGYGSAQNNLAVFYATQNPPWIGLARYHYQKALDAGHPRNEELEKILEQKSAAQ